MADIVIFVPPDPPQVLLHILDWNQPECAQGSA